MVRLEMTLSPSEFRRSLPAAVGGPYTEDADGFRGGDGLRAWRIRVADLPPLRLGALALERLRVDLEFAGFEPDEEAVFLERFRANTQRGGG